MIPGLASNSRSRLVPVLEVMHHSVDPRTEKAQAKLARIGPMDVLKELVWKESLQMKDEGLMVTLSPKKASAK